MKITTADGKTMEFDKELVTPHRAAALLLDNTHNRPLNKKRVKELADAMVANDFRFVGDPVRISKTNVVLDGQHRLAAIVLSDRAQEMIVMTGLDDDDQLYMDSGFRRTPGDQVGLRLDLPQSNAIAGVGRLVLRWQRGNIVYPKYPSNAELIRFIETDQDRIVEATKRSRILMRDVSAGGAPSGAALYRMSLVNDGLAANVYEWLRTGAGMQVGHPVLTLRNALVSRRKAERWTSEEELEAYVRTWNYLVKNRELKTLKVKGGNPLTEAQFKLMGS